MFTLMAKNTMTMTLLKLNVGAFLVFNIAFPLFSGAELFTTPFYTFGLLPGAFWAGALWQPLTSMFLHAGFLHLLLNMVALFSLGQSLERQLGRHNFAKVYLISGLVGAAFIVIFQSDLAIPTVGASGAVSGLLGVMAFTSPNSPLLLFFFPVKARTAALVLGFFSLFLAFIGSTAGISHLGHLGGLLAGAVYGFTFTQRELSSNLDWFQNFFTAKPTNEKVYQPQEKVLKYDPYTGRYYYEIS